MHRSVGVVMQAFTFIVKALSLAELRGKLPPAMNSEVQKMQCECCGLSEECTEKYIGTIRELFCGHWICGLCSEAVKEERDRMGRQVPIEEALTAHIALCMKFNKTGRSNPALDIAGGMCQLLKRTSSSNGLGFKSLNPRSKQITRANLSRSSSCIPAFTTD